MTIVDELKKLIVARGGNVAGIQTIAEAVAELVRLENSSGDSSSF